MIKFCIWFFCEILGVWFIWATYTAVKFFIEDAQGQHAAYSMGTGSAVGGFIVLPIFATVIYSVAAGIMAQDMLDD